MSSAGRGRVRVHCAPGEVITIIDISSTAQQTQPATGSGIAKLDQRGNGSLLPPVGPFIRSILFRSDRSGGGGGSSQSDRRFTLHARALRQSGTNSFRTHIVRLCRCFAVAPSSLLAAERNAALVCVWCGFVCRQTSSVTVGTAVVRKSTKHMVGELFALV